MIGWCPRNDIHTTLTAAFRLTFGPAPHLALPLTEHRSHPSDTEHPTYTCVLSHFAKFRECNLHKGVQAWINE